MKRLSRDKKLRQLRCQRNALRRKVARKRRKRASRRLRLDSRNRIVAPKVLSIGAARQRNELLRFLGELREQIVVNRRPTVIDFTMTTRMVAGGCLLLTAELHRAKELTDNTVQVRCIRPRNAKVAQVLKQIGLLDLLGDKSRIRPTFDDVIHWCFASGYEVEGEKYETILGHYDGRIATSLLGDLFKGVTEAMTNCHHHAYISPRQDGLVVEREKRNWWMFSQERDGWLTVVFCDLGIGIPASLPKQQPQLWKKLMTLGKAGTDSYVIQEAIEHSASRTRKAYRGHGLRQLRQVAQDNGGKLAIYSNSGCYTFNNGNEQLLEFSTSILGTLIQWTLPIAKESLQ